MAYRTLSLICRTFGSDIPWSRGKYYYHIHEITVPILFNDMETLSNQRYKTFRVHSEEGNEIHFEQPWFHLEEAWLGGGGGGGIVLLKYIIDVDKC